MLQVSHIQFHSAGIATSYPHGYEIPVAGPAESWDANLIHTLIEVMFVLSFLEARLVLLKESTPELCKGGFMVDTPDFRALNFDPFTL